MALTPKSFSTLVQDAAAAIQGKVSSMLDFSVGSVLRAIVEANSAVVLWLQGLILQLLSTTRAATSSGADLDSWMADYSFYRLPAVPAEGVVTFSRFTPTLQATVPVGTIVQTGDGAQQYTVIADTNQTAYNPTLKAYVLPAGVASITATVQAVNAGTQGNVIAGAINQIAVSLPGVDTVSNGAVFSNGADAESDEALRVRFRLYLATLEKATKAAIAAAINSVQQGLSFTLTEDVDKDGVPKPGYFYVVIDNATGTPDSTLVSTVYNAIDAVRAAGVAFDVYGPTVLSVSVSLSIMTGATYVHADVVDLVTTAITDYLNSIPLGQGLSYSRIAQVAYSASPGVTNVTGVLVNGATNDLETSSTEVIKAGTVTVS